jgi:hypothetical protein
MCWILSLSLGPLGRRWRAAGAFTSRRGPGEGIFFHTFAAVDQEGPSLTPSPLPRPRGGGGVLEVG